MKKPPEASLMMGNLGQLKHTVIQCSCGQTVSVSSVKNPIRHGQLLNISFILFYFIPPKADIDFIDSGEATYDILIFVFVAE